MRRSATLALLVLSFAAACGGAGRPSRPGTAVAAEQTTLVVDNQNFTDMTIYLVNGGQRIRLGRAIGKSTTSMTIRRSQLSFAREVQFEAHPIGGRGQSTTNRLWVNPGDRLTLVIPPR